MITPGLARTVRSDRTARTASPLHCRHDHGLPRVCGMRRAQPPYRLVSAALRERVESGEWLPGEQLPTVREIAAQYAVSVTTARRALATLQDAGLVVVTPGWGAFRSES
jgi:GntR family transcriptional regulator